MFKIIHIFVIGLLATFIMAGCAKSDATEDNTAPQTPITISSIQLTTQSGDTNVTVPVNISGKLRAIATYSDHTSKDVTDDVRYNSTDSDVVEVVPGGTAKAHQSGNTEITAALENVTSNKVAVTVTNATLVSIEVNPAETTVPKGTATPYSAVGTYSDGDIVVITDDVTWNSSDASVAEMDKNFAKSIAQGDTVITAVHDSITSNEAALHVTDAVLTTLDIQRAGASPAITGDNKFIVGTSIYSMAIGTYSDGSQRDVTDIVTWGTDTADTVSVSQDGRIDALRAGAANVHVNYEAVESSDPIRDVVTGEVHDASVISLSVSGSHESVVNTMIILTAIAGFDNDDAVDVTETAVWRSSNPDITVLKGKVSATKVGEADITVVFDDYEAVHHVRFTKATFDHIEIQENYCAGGNCPKITGKSVTIELVDDVSYPTDPNGLSANAYYPTAWAVYTDGRKEYINTDTIWWSEDQNAAYVNYLKGSFVFGKDLSPKVEIKATYKDKSAVFYVNVVAQAGRTLDEIVIKNGWNETLPDITEASVVVGAKTPLVAYGWFTYADGTRDLEYINANVLWSSSDLSTAWINSAFSSYVTGVKEGTADINATWQGKTATVHMTVVADTSPTLSSIFFEKGCGSTQTGEIIDAAHPLLLSVGQEQCINAWGNYSDGNVSRLTTTVFWNSNDRDIATIDPLQRNSRVVGVALGSTEITATEDGVMGEAPVEVVELDSVYIEGTDEAPIGVTQQLNAIVYLTNGKAYNVNDRVNWESNSTSLATIDADGLVTALAIGNVTFTATGKSDSNKTVTHEMKIVDATLVSIQIEKSYNPSVPQPISTLDVEISTEEYITAWGIYTDGTRRYINTDTVWWSSDQQIASINYLDSSNVYGKNLGDANITARFGGKEASLAVTVVNSGPELLSIEIRDGWGNSNDVTDGQIDIEVGSKQAVVTYGHYDDGSRKDINAKVFWDSSDSKIAAIFDTINSDVHGVSIGQATITASWQGVSAHVTANVVASTAPVLDHIEIQRAYVEDGSGEVLSIDNPLVLQVGDVQYITAWAVFENGDKEYVNTQAFWRSDDQTIASMPLLQTSSNVTAEAPGETTVNATYDGMTATAKVIVQNAPGKLVLENIQWDKAGTTLTPDGLTANGTSDAHAVWYHVTEGNGFEVGQKLSTISFDFAATGAGGATAYVNVYVKDTNSNDVRLIIGIDDTANNGYMTWDLAMAAGFGDYTIRRYVESSLDGITEGNFYLRIGESSYSGSDPFEITKFLITTP